MGNTGEGGPGGHTHRLSPPNRRDFLKLSALGALAAVGTPYAAEHLAALGRQAERMGRGNALPGRIVLLHDAAMNAHSPTIDRDRVELAVHLGVRLLTGSDDTAAAFESLFPALHSGSTFAVKVNCIGPTDTRWEVVRGVVSGFAQMLGETYDVSQVTIFDPHNLHAHGYDESEFTFNGNYPLISHSGNASGSGYYVWENHELSRYILECDYVIDIPVLKASGVENNQITGAFKNHYGSCSPQNLCNDIPGMLTLNADPNVKDKTCLVLTDALRGVFYGNCCQPPQVWSNYPEGTPNTLFFATDPVTNEYWARDIINAQRIADGYPPKPCPWIEEASKEPYDLGISDPDLMTVINYDPACVHDQPGTLLGGTFVAPNVPNPFSEQTTLRFRMARPGHAKLQIVDAAGRSVRRLARGDFPAGYSAIRWNGRDSRGRRAVAGIYFVQLKVGAMVKSRRIIMTR